MNNGEVEKIEARLLLEAAGRKRNGDGTGHLPAHRAGTPGNARYNKRGDPRKGNESPDHLVVNGYGQFNRFNGSMSGGSAFTFIIPVTPQEGNES